MISESIQTLSTQFHLLFKGSVEKVVWHNYATEYFEGVIRGMRSRLLQASYRLLTSIKKNANPVCCCDHTVVISTAIGYHNLPPINLILALTIINKVN